MRKETVSALCAQCIDRIHRYGTRACIENLAVTFTENAKRGDYDALSDDEYKILLAEVEELARLWDERPSRTARDILTGILAGAHGISPDQRDGLADAFASLLAAPAQPGGPSGPDDDPFGPDALSDEDPFGYGGEPFASRRPAEIRDAVARRVLGQPEAVKAAALIVYNQLAGRRTNAVFCGPSGCGKSEIWRTLSTEYPGMVRMMDFSRFAADGWRGSLHVRDIFDGIDPNDIKRNGLIVVLDEADKVVCEHAVGAGGTDYHALLQNNLLKIMDGDEIEFGADENKKAALAVDCSKVSVVMLGAFERLMDGKARDAKHIGFGSAPGAAAGTHRDISHQDLIRAGMRREIAGRVNRIVALDPLSTDDYKSILMGPVLAGIRKALGCEVGIGRAAAGALAEQAIASGLGVRWMKSAVQNAIDDAMFDAPEAKSWSVTLRDGKLYCRARRPRASRAGADSPAASRGGTIPQKGPMEGWAVFDVGGGESCRKNQKEESTMSHMKNVAITYHLSRPGEEADRLVTLPMLPELAAAIRPGEDNEVLDAVLAGLAALQGYDSADLRSASILADDTQVDPLAGVDGWNPADEDQVPGEGSGR